MYFIPESKADAVLDEPNNTNPEKKDYRTWEKQGLVRIIPGNEVDVSYVVHWYYSLYEQYGMKPFKVGYDNWMSKEFTKMIEEYFGDEILERIQMNFSALSNPMRLVEADLRSNKLIYNDHEIDKWCLRNTSFRTDNLGQIMPVKVQGQAKNRIDGSLGFIIAYATMSRYKNEYLQLVKGTAV